MNRDLKEDFPFSTVHLYVYVSLEFEISNVSYKVHERFSNSSEVALHQRGKNSQLIQYAYQINILSLARY